MPSKASPETRAAIEDLLAKKQFKEALRLANEEVRRHPGDHRLLNLAADIYLKFRKADTAAHLLRHVANIHASSGAPAKAVVALKKIQNIGRDDPKMYESIAARIKPADKPPDPPQFDTGPLTETVEMPLPQATEMRVVDEAELVNDVVPSPLFGDFSRGELLAMMKGLQLQVFDAGDIIVAEGDAGDSLFILTSGIVKAYVRGKDQHLRHVRTLHDGDFFGEISIFTGGRRTATITAATRCELLELDRPTLDSITAAHPHVSEVMRKFYDERVASDRLLT
jgi:hypothetical protein